MVKNDKVIKIPLDTFASNIRGEELLFPNYATQIINLANQNAQGTRPNVVGQMSELIQECPSNDYVEWGEWYLETMPNAVDEATRRIVDMIEKFKKVIVQIDEDMVRAWVEDLLITKTFIGLKAQQGILQEVAKIKGTSYRLATPDEEAKGIDGYVGDTPISVKPTTYKTKDMLRESIDVKIVYYEKTKDAIKIDLSDL